MKAMRFTIEDSQVSEEVKKLRIIFTSTAWGQGSDTCPSCNKAPVQLLFTESIEFNGKYVVGQCLLCKQLVAYKGLVHDGKRSKIRNHTRKNIFGGNPIIGKQIEILLRHLVSQMPTNQKHHVKTQMFRKKPSEKKDDQEAQLSFDLCTCNS